MCLKFLAGAQVGLHCPHRGSWGSSPGLPVARSAPAGQNMVLTFLRKMKTMLHHDHKLHTCPDCTAINKEYNQSIKSMPLTLPQSSLKQYQFHGNLDLHTRHIYKLQTSSMVLDPPADIFNITEFQFDGCEEELLLSHHKHSTTQINSSQKVQTVQ